MFFFIGKTSLYSQNNTIESIGDVTQIALPVTALATSIIKKDKKGILKFAESYGTTFVITRILKEAIKKNDQENLGVLIVSLLVILLLLFLELPFYKSVMVGNLVFLLTH